MPNDFFDPEDNEFEDELDDKFLTSYGLGTTCGLDEADDDLTPGDADEDLIPGEEREADDAEEMRRTFRRLNIPLTLVRSLLQPEEVSTEEEREHARDYHRRYRAGEVDAVAAKEFQRFAKPRAGRFEENRKNLAYYLPPSLRDAMKIAVQEGGTERRVFCADALEGWLGTGEPVERIPPTTEGFRGRVFLFDELSASLYDRLDRYTRSSVGTRKVPLYRVMEAAIRWKLAKLAGEAVVRADLEREAESAQRRSQRAKSVREQAARVQSRDQQ